MTRLGSRQPGHELVASWDNGLGASFLALDIYSHVQPTMRAEAVAALDCRFESGIRLHPLCRQFCRQDQEAPRLRGLLLSSTGSKNGGAGGIRTLYLNTASVEGSCLWWCPTVLVRI